jgi:hypothetical protein
MLPLIPESRASEPPKASSWSNPLYWIVSPSDLLAFGVAGPIAGVIVGLVATLMLYGLEQRRYEASFRRSRAILELPKPKPHLSEGITAGICISIPSTAFLWFIAFLWPMIRKPTAATSFSGSLAGTFCLVVYFFGRTLNAKNPEEQVFELLGVVALGALFGFLTTSLVRVMERVVQMLARRSQPPPSGVK